MLGALRLLEVQVRISGLSLVLRKVISNQYLLCLKELVVVDAKIPPDESLS